MSFAQAAAAAGYRLDGDPIRGGTGVVYRAVDLADERPVAIKLPAPGVDLDLLVFDPVSLQPVERYQTASGNEAGTCRIL